MLRQQVDGLSAELAKATAGQGALTAQIRVLDEEKQILREKLLSVARNDESYRQQIEQLTRRNENLMSQLNLTREQRVRLRNAVIGAIDDEDRRFTPLRNISLTIYSPKTPKARYFA